VPRAVALALLLSLLMPGPAEAGGNPARGAEIYQRCAACHALARNRTGPKHCGLIGRKAGSLPGFDYSPALRDSGIVWDARTLDRFLAEPLAMVPRSTMTYAGIKDAQERADLIAYLARATADSPDCR